MSGNKANLIGIGELFSRTWDVFKQRWLTLLGVVLLGILFMAAAIGIPTAAGTMLEMPIIEAVGVFAGFLVVFWHIAAFVFAVTDERLTAFAAFKVGGRRLLAFAWLAFVFGFMLMGGFMLFIIPGILFSVWFYFSFFVLASEDERGMTALLKSKAYVEGYWGAVFLRFFLLFFLIPLVLNLAVSTLGGLIGGLVGDPIIAMVIMVFLAIPVVIFPLFSIVAAYLIYEDLRTIKKGHGL